MHSHGRELKTFAEPVSPDDLKQGEVYFSVQFIDEDLLIPVVEPWIFLGRNLSGENPDRLFFQNAESYGNGLRYESATENDHPEFQVATAQNISHIFEYERALDVLINCAQRRGGRPPTL